MAKNLQINILIILIISTFNLVNSQNIITSWNYYKVQMYELETLGELFTYENLKDATFNDFTEDEVSISNIKLKEVHQSLYDSYLDFKKGLLLLSPDKVSLSFSFDYTFGQNSSNGTFDFKINTIRIKIKNNKEDQSQSFNITGEYSDEDFNVYEISDKFITKNVRYAIYKGFKRLNFLNNNIFGKINLIDHYKNRLSKKADFKLVTGSFLDNKEITINLNRFLGFCEDVEGKAQTALCYYSGEINKEEDKTDRSKVPLKNQAFLNSSDTYNIFINMNLLDKIAKNISTEKINEKTYDKNTPKKTLPYDFTVTSLKKYFNGLDEYDDTLEFSTKINNIEFDTKNAKFTIAFNIGEKLNVFALNVELSFTCDFTLKRNVRLNLCLKDVSGLKVSISAGSASIKDETGLISAIQESFDFKNIPICASDDGVSFRDYYTKISKIQALGEGLYLFGEQLYQ